LAQVSAILAEHVANFADGAVAVVGGHLGDQRYSAWAVTFKGDLFVCSAGQFAGTALDGALDVVRRHVLGFGRGNGSPQARISFRITAAALGRHGYFFDQASEYLAA